MYKIFISCNFFGNILKLSRAAGFQFSAALGIQLNRFERCLANLYLWSRRDDYNQNEWSISSNFSLIWHQHYHNQHNLKMIITVCADNWSWALCSPNWSFLLKNAFVVTWGSSGDSQVIPDSSQICITAPPSTTQV